jgi:hypothetical protein
MEGEGKLCECLLLGEEDGDLAGGQTDESVFLGREGCDGRAVRVAS